MNEEMNDEENKNTIEKIRKLKVWFFERNYEVYKYQEWR